MSAACNRFDVLDARAAVLCVVHVFGVFVRVEGCAHGVIADGVREELQSALIELRDGRFVFVRIPKQFAFCGWVVGVGLEHRGGVRFDDAIDHHLHHAAREPVASVFFAGLFDRVDIFGTQLRRVQKIGDVHAQRQIAAAAQFIVESELFEIATGAVNACQAIFIGPMQAGTKSCKFFGSSEFRYEFADQTACGFLQSSGGLAGLGIAHDGAVGGIWRCPY